MDHSLTGSNEIPPVSMVEWTCLRHPRPASPSTANW